MSPRASSAVITPDETPAARITRLVNDPQRTAQLRALLGDDERMLERFRTVALHAVTSNPKVLECEPASLVSAIRDAATMGLEPTGLGGDGAIVPYRDRDSGKSYAQFQPGWQGLLKLVRRSGGILTAATQLVYFGDDFRLDLGDWHKPIHHVPALGPRGAYAGVYAYVVLTTGYADVEWMPWAEVELAKRKANGGREPRPGTPWADWIGEMARKTVLRRLIKRLPKSFALELAAEADARLDEAERVERSGAAQPTRAVAAIRERLGIAAPAVLDRDGVGTLSSDGPPPRDHDEMPGDEVPLPTAVSGGGDEPAEERPAAVQLCGAASPYPADGPDSSRCDQPAGHEGLHKNGAQESWR